MLTHKGTQTLTTKRLTLRRFTMGDAQPMYDNWASDEEVTKYLTWPTHSGVEVTKLVLRDWISGYEKNDFYQWAIVLDDEPIGSISVVAHSDLVGKALIGYCIGRAWWRRGVTSEALNAVIRFLFDQVGMNRIEACHAVENPHSGGVMKKCGMQFEGIHRQSSWCNAGICDTAWYAILKGEGA